MRENNKCNKDCEREVLVGNVLYKYDLNEVNEYTYDLVATPCNVPTSVFCIARITVRENCCNNMEYFQAFINTDPVQIIQDCDICNIIARAIESYFDNTGLFNMNNNCNCRNTFGLF